MFLTLHFVWQMAKTFYTYTLCFFIQMPLPISGLLVVCKSYFSISLLLHLWWIQLAGIWKWCEILRWLIVSCFLQPLQNCWTMQLMRWLFFFWFVEPYFYFFNSCSIGDAQSCSLGGLGLQRIRMLPLIFLLLTFLRSKFLFFGRLQYFLITYYFIGLNLLVHKTQINVFGFWSWCLKLMALYAFPWLIKIWAFICTFVLHVFTNNYIYCHNLRDEIF